MTLRLPRDFQHLIEFRKLEEIVGKTNATILFMALWVEMGYSVEATGAAGFMSDQDEFVFQRSLARLIEMPLRRLQAAGLLKKVPGGYECPMFVLYNGQLDANFIPDETDASWQLFQNGKAKMQSEGSEMLASLPMLAWAGKDGTIEIETMKKIVLLIKIWDAILKVGKRPPAEFDPPLINAALDVIKDYSDVQITVILRRAFEVSRRKNLPPGFTRSTIICLERFDDIVALLMPADGYVRWSKKRTHSDLTS